MAIFKGNGLRRSLKGFRHLLPASLLSLLSSSDLETLLEYERGLRDDMFRVDGARMGFYLLCALDSDRFKGIVQDALKLDGERSLKRYSKNWKPFLRLLMLHASAPQSCEPISSVDCNTYTGDKTTVTRWLMLEDKWLLPSGWKNHFRISPKGAKIVELCIKQSEQQYSAFLVGQLKLKRDRMGDLIED